jgi:isochorismate synthase EntC
MGATPENLLTVEGGVGKVMALAGTLTAAQSGWTDKERLEQTVTSRFIAEALESSGIVGAKESQMGELAMGNIKHLVSEWAFGGVSDRPWRLLEKLHPTPAVGGYPQHLACEWLKSNEGFDRGLYAGYLGWVGAQKSVFYVTLRCSKIVKNGYTLFAGCGVNAGSEVEVEWQETLAKMDLLGQYLPE